MLGRRVVRILQQRDALLAVKTAGKLARRPLVTWHAFPRYSQQRQERNRARGITAWVSAMKPREPKRLAHQAAARTRNRLRDHWLSEEVAAFTDAGEPPALVEAAGASDGRATDADGEGA